MPRRALDITGRRFGRLVAVERDRSKRQAAWSCLCDCGSSKTVASGHLRSGAVESCGCLRLEKVTNDLTGRLFGRWQVVARARNVGPEIKWHCRCSCGTEREIYGSSLKKGSSTSCGCYQKQTVRDYFEHRAAMRRIERDIDRLYAAAASAPDAQN